MPPLRVAHSVKKEIFKNQEKQYSFHYAQINIDMDTAYKRRVDRRNCPTAYSPCTIHIPSPYCSSSTPLSQPYRLTHCES